MKRLWKWLRPDKHPAIERNRAHFAEFDRDLPIENFDFVSLDTELTGFNHRKDEIVSIGAVRIRNLRIVIGDNFFSYVRPTRSIPKDSTLVHRITTSQIKTAPSLNEILPEFVDFCGDALLVGHYIALDMGFLNKACREMLGARMENPCLDSMRLAYAYQEVQRRSYYDVFETRMSYNLTELSKRYRLPLFAKHDALEDALQAAYLFLFLIRRLQAAGCVTLRDLDTIGRGSPF